MSKKDREFFEKTIKKYNSIRKSLCEQTPKNLKIIDDFMNRKKEPTKDLPEEVKYFHTWYRCSKRYKGTIKIYPPCKEPRESLIFQEFTPPVCPEK
jgi:hypothetical protein